MEKRAIVRGVNDKTQSRVALLKKQFEEEVKLSPLYYVEQKLERSKTGCIKRIKTGLGELAIDVKVEHTSGYLRIKMQSGTFKRNPSFYLLTILSWN